jgi:hypothetical protein
MLTSSSSLCSCSMQSSGSVLGNHGNAGLCRTNGGRGLAGTSHILAPSGLHLDLQPVWLFIEDFVKLGIYRRRAGLLHWQKWFRPLQANRV